MGNVFATNETIPEYDNIGDRIVTLLQVHADHIAKEQAT